MSGPPAQAQQPGPPSASPRLPEAAVAMLGEARAALAHADAELSAVDAGVHRSPLARNAVIYGAYALLFALTQLPLLAMLAAARTVPVIVTAPCGLALAIVSFAVAWLTIGFLYRQPGGQQAPRTPLLGALISLLATAPGLVALLWTVGGAIRG